MAFEIASTNLVVELGVILALLMGWQFTVAQFVGGPIMIVALAVLFRIFCANGCCARPGSRRSAGSPVDGRACRDGRVDPDGGLVRAAAALA